MLGRADRPPSSSIHLASRDSSTRPGTSSSSRPYSRGTDPSPVENERAPSGNALQDAIDDPSFPLDDNLLQTLVSSLCTCTTRDVIRLPAFRLEELLQIFCRGQSQLLSEFKLTEPLFVCYLLCLYVTLRADVPEAFLIRFMTVLQHVMCESLVVVQNFPFGNMKLDKNGKRLSSWLRSPLTV